MKHFTLLIFSLFLIAGCANSQTQSQATYEDVDAAKFKQLADAKKGIVLDVRTPEEVAEGHIANSVNIDFYKDDFEQKVKQLSKDKEIYVYCAAGGRSSDAAKLLQKNGYKVYNLEDGFEDWKKKGYPVVE